MAKRSKAYLNCLRKLGKARQARWRNLLSRRKDDQDENGGKVGNPSKTSAKSSAKSFNGAKEKDKKCSICLKERVRIRKCRKNLDLKDSVSVMYLVKKVLEIPNEECAKYLEKYGNPSHWINLCKPCWVTLIKAQDIDSQIQKLQSELDELNKLLFDYMSVKIEDYENEDMIGIKPLSWMNANFEIRQYFRNSRISSDDVDVDEDTFETEMEFTDEFINTETIKEEIELESYQMEDPLCVEPQTTTLILPVDCQNETSSKQKDFYNSDSETGYCEEGSPCEPDEELNINKDISQSEEISPKINVIHSDSNTEESNISNKDLQSEQGEIYDTNKNQTNPTSVHPSSETPQIQSSSVPDEALISSTKKCPITQPNVKKDSDTAKSSSSKLKPVEKTSETIGLGPSKHKRKKANIDLEEPLDEGKMLVCGWTDCNSVLSSSISLQNHVNENHSGKFKCPFCYYKLSKFITLEKHIDKDHRSLSLEISKIVGASQIQITDDGKLELKCERDDCSEVFPTYLSLTKHRSEVHTIGLKCTENSCKKKFVAPKYLERHIREEHTSPSSLECSGCNKIFLKSRRFFAHLKKDNPECRQKAIKCSDCPRLFSTNEAATVHFQVYHIPPLELPFACSQCDKKYVKKEYLQKHMNYGHAPRKVCERCGASFTTNYGLKNHTQIVHLNREPGGQRFPCKVCKREFFNILNCRTHEKLHSEESPYLCTVCGKAYKTKTQLNTHYWSHDPDRYEKYSLYKYGKGKTDVGVKRKRKNTNSEGGTVDKPGSESIEVETGDQGNKKQ